jgi:hypothetical protein
VADELRGLTDFNERDSHGNLLVLAEDVTGHVDNGASITLSDAEGNSVTGDVVDVSLSLIRVRPDWSTWISAERPQQQRWAVTQRRWASPSTLIVSVSVESASESDDPIIDLMRAVADASGRVSTGSSQPARRTS